MAVLMRSRMATRGMGCRRAGSGERRTLPGVRWVVSSGRGAWVSSLTGKKKADGPQFCQLRRFLVFGVVWESSREGETPRRFSSRREPGWSPRLAFLDARSASGSLAPALLFLQRGEILDEVDEVVLREGLIQAAGH